LSRKHGLPEAHDYRDEGCPDGYLPSCLSCPLEVCRYDESVSGKGGKRYLEHQARNERIVALFEQGMNADQIAEREQLSRRSVFRAAESVRGRR
jgi:hypothetical protein